MKAILNILPPSLPSGGELIQTLTPTLTLGCPYLFTPGREGSTPESELCLGLGSGIVHPYLFPQGRDGGNAHISPLSLPAGER